MILTTCMRDWEVVENEMIIGCVVNIMWLVIRINYLNQEQKITGQENITAYAWINYYSILPHNSVHVPLDDKHVAINIEDPNAYEHKWSLDFDVGRNKSL